LVFNTAIKTVRVDFGVAEGHRDVATQLKYFRLGKSRVDGMKIKGKHNYLPSQAIDFYGYVNGGTSYSTAVMCYLAAYFMAVADMLFDAGKIEHKLRWGGNWDKDGEILTDQGFDDMPHLEIYKPK
jgi:peptidoglycan L-alanyl-D-glutamate endopeptidase CwlK